MSSIFIRRLCLILALSIFPASMVMADNMASPAIAQMANIMQNLNHFPNADDKKTLQAIIEDQSSNKNEHTLAKAIMNIQHSVNSADAPALKSIASAGDATQHEKDLAEIILHLNHSPSDADKKKLMMMH